jgi:hypothetical protein
MLLWRIALLDCADGVFVFKNKDQSTSSKTLHTQIYLLGETFAKLFDHVIGNRHDA